LGLSRNKVAVPEGAAGTPPFWSHPSPRVLTMSIQNHLLLKFINLLKLQQPKTRARVKGLTPLKAGQLANEAIRSI
jgi:hypothetical protein